MDSPIAGGAYELLCTVSVAEGMQGTPVLQWNNYTNSDITVGRVVSESEMTILPLEFTVLRVLHNGEYACQVTLYSLALESPLIVTATTTLVVESK